MTGSLFALALLLQPPQAPARSSTPTHPFGTLREQAALRQEWLRYRLDSIMPALMRQYVVRMWIIPMREYDEDPMFWSLVSATTFFGRGRTIYVFTDPGAGKPIERLALGGASPNRTSSMMLSVDQRILKYRSALGRGDTPRRAPRTALCYSTVSCGAHSLECRPIGNRGLTLLWGDTPRRAPRLPDENHERC
jgi:hypothetical protein